MSIIQTEDLKTALASLLAVVETRGTIPILTTIQVTVGPGDDSGYQPITLRATDLDVQVEHAIVGRGGEPFSFCIKVDYLRNAVKTAGGEITVTTNDLGQAVIVAGGELKASTLPTSDFPVMGNDLGQNPLVIQTAAAELLATLDSVAPAMSNEETRYYLNGALLDATDQQALRVVATDGHRLHLAPLPALKVVDGGGAKMDGWGGAEDGRSGGIIPRRTVTALRKALKSVGGEVTLSLSRSKMLLEAGGLTITSKLIDGSFPDYRRVIPKKVDAEFTFSLAAPVLKKAVVDGAKFGWGGTVSIGLTGGNVSVRAKTEDCEENVFPVQGVTVDGVHGKDTFEIGVRGKYLVDVLGLTKGPATLFFISPTDPIVISFADAPDATFVVMPLRI